MSERSTNQDFKRPALERSNAGAFARLVKFLKALWKLILALFGIRRPEPMVRKAFVVPPPVQKPARPVPLFRKRHGDADPDNREGVELRENPGFVYTGLSELQPHYVARADVMRIAMMMKGKDGQDVAELVRKLLHAPSLLPKPTRESSPDLTTAQGYLRALGNALLNGDLEGYRLLRSQLEHHLGMSIDDRRLTQRAYWNLALRRLSYLPVDGHSVLEFRDLIVPGGVIDLLERRLRDVRSGRVRDDDDVLVPRTAKKNGSDEDDSGKPNGNKDDKTSTIEDLRAHGASATSSAAAAASLRPGEGFVDPRKPAGAGILAKPEAGQSVAPAAQQARPGEAPPALGVNETLKTEASAKAGQAAPDIAPASTPSSAPSSVQRPASVDDAKPAQQAERPATAERQDAAKPAAQGAKESKAEASPQEPSKSAGAASRTEAKAGFDGRTAGTRDNGTMSGDDVHTASTHAAGGYHAGDHAARAEQRAETTGGWGERPIDADRHAEERKEEARPRERVDAAAPRGDSEPASFTAATGASSAGSVLSEAEPSSRGDAPATERVERPHLSVDLQYRVDEFLKNAEAAESLVNPAAIAIAARDLATDPADQKHIAEFLSYVAKARDKGWEVTEKEAEAVETVAPRQRPAQRAEKGPEGERPNAPQARAGRVYQKREDINKMRARNGIAGDFSVAGAAGQPKAPPTAGAPKPDEKTQRQRKRDDGPSLD